MEGMSICYENTHLLKLFVVGITIVSEPGVVPPLFSVREAYSDDESPVK